MIKGTTSSGFNFEISEEVLDDYELLEMLTDIDRGNEGLTPVMVRTLLGEEQTNALKDHIRANGRVSAKKLLTEVAEIFTSINSGKNF